MDYKDNRLTTPTQSHGLSPNNWTKLIIIYKKKKTLEIRENDWQKGKYEWQGMGWQIGKVVDITLSHDLAKVMVTTYPWYPIIGFNSFCPVLRCLTCTYATCLINLHLVRIPHHHLLIPKCVLPLLQSDLLSNESVNHAAPPVSPVALVYTSLAALDLVKPLALTLLLNPWMLLL